MSPAAGQAAWSETAAAKINLFLHVTGRRDDGYHLLDSMAVFCNAADRITAEPDTQLRLTLSGPFGSGLQADPGNNLVLRAARALARPVASGIGGGSSDAAGALRLLQRLWAAEGRIESVDEPALLALAAGLGADVPVCLARRPARMRGVGEILTAPPGLPDVGMVLVNCGEAVATPAVFRARKPEFRREADLPRAWPDVASLAEGLARLSNDLEDAARRLCPTIGAVLAALRDLPGCRFARMSGSGATCFGLFDTEAAAREAAGSGGMPAHWWVWGGGLYRPD